MQTIDYFITNNDKIETWALHEEKKEKDKKSVFSIVRVYV